MSGIDESKLPGASPTESSYTGWQGVIPAFLTIFMIPLTFSIAEGLSIGFIAYPPVKSFQGKAHEVPIGTWVIAGIFVARFIFMTLRFE